MPRKCKHPYCRNEAAPKRRECHKCRARGFRKRNPALASYHGLKSGAKRREIPFALTFGQFLKFARKTAYFAGKGRSWEGFTIDRINSDKGYIIGNLRVIPNHENARKGKKVLSYDWETGYAVYL